METNGTSSRKAPFGMISFIAYQWYVLPIQAVVFILLHLVLLKLAYREPRFADVLVLGWAASSVLISWVLFGFGILTSGYFADWFGPTASMLAIRLTATGFPLLVSGTLVGLAWRSWLPFIAAGAATIGITMFLHRLESRNEKLLAISVWNLAYVFGALPIVLASRKQSKHTLSRA